MKRSALIAAALAVVLLAAGCGGSSSSSSSGGSSSASGSCPVDAFKKAPGKTNVVIWSSYVGKTEQALEAIAQAYNASQPKVNVQVEVEGAGYQELLAKFQQVLPTNKLPAILLAEDKDTQYMADTGKVLAAQDCIDADKDPNAKIGDMVPAVKAAYSIDGRLEAASANVSTVVLYYNKDQFQKAGLDPNKPPTTLSELMADAQKLKAAGVSKEPLAMQTDPWYVEQWITGDGQTVVNHDNGRKGGHATAATLENNPAAKYVFNWLAEMKKDDLVNAVSRTDGQINDYLAAATQQSSMLLQTSTAITTIDGILTGTFDPADLGLSSKYDYLKGTKIVLNLGVAEDPGIKAPGKGQVGGGAWYITNTGSAAVQSAAWDFVKYFNEVKNQVTWTQTGSYLPLRSSVKNDPTVESDWTTTNKGKWLATAYQGIASLNANFPGPLIGPYTDFRTAIQDAEENVVLNGGDPTAALKSAQDAVTKALVTYNKNNF